MYSDEILNHFKNPQHVGELTAADGVGIAHGGEQCPHDIAHFWIRVRAGRVVAVSHKTKGCPVAIASSSMTAVLAQGQTLEDAEALTTELVAQKLGGMPERKLDSIVGPAALRNAIADYHKRGCSSESRAEDGDGGAHP